MANFRTHLGVGTVVSGLCATLTLAAAVITKNDILAVALAGVLGGMLPDIDLQKSRPSRIIFFFLGLFFSFCALFAHVGKLSIVELWALWLGVFLGVRYGLQLLFHRFARHRGIFHSILAGIFFLVLTTLVFYYILGKDPLVSWAGGVFMFIGYMVHLSLDEIYSVDFDGNRVKRSFGTALKLFEYRNVTVSCIMTAAIGALFLITPPLSDVFEVASNRPISNVISQRFLPEGTPFGLDKTLEHLTELVGSKEETPSPDAQPLADPITTGSLPVEDPEAGSPQ